MNSSMPEKVFLEKVFDRQEAPSPGTYYATHHKSWCRKRPFHQKVCQIILASYGQEIRVTINIILSSRFVSEWSRKWNYVKSIATTCNCM